MLNRLFRKLVRSRKPISVEDNEAKRALRRAERALRKTDRNVVEAFGNAPSGSAAYIARIMPRIDAGKLHPTLGPKLKPGAAESAQRFVDKLCARGMLPTHKVIDFGCGTLRIGAPLIDFLEADCYVGFDLDQRLLDLGLASLPNGLAERKRPLLLVISEQSIARGGNIIPDYLFSMGVVQHVPPEELGVYFRNVGALAHRGTDVAIQVSQLIDIPVRRSKNSWRHSLKSIEASISAAGLTIKSFESRNGSDGVFMLEKAIAPT